MRKLLLRVLLPSLLLCLAEAPIYAQTENLLQNPRADVAAQHWQAFGGATIEEVKGNQHFVVRNGGYFLQDVMLPENSEGKFAVLIGNGSTERVNPDGAITGLPYLYGYMMASGKPVGVSILDYLQGNEMLCSATVVGEWVRMWGIFTVPTGTGKIRFFLNQAERQGLPQNGSAARFDDLGLYLFATKKEAQLFIQQRQ
jgi:hypothetical protein